MALRRLVEMPIGNYSPPKSKLRGPRAQRVNDPVQVAGSKWQMSGEKRECVDVLCRYLGPLGRQLASDVQFYFTEMGAFGGTGCLSLSFALSCTRGWTCLFGV